MRWRAALEKAWAAATPGGGGSSVTIGQGGAVSPSDSAVQMQSGGEALVSGTLRTDGVTLRSAQWRVQPVEPANAPALVLGNADCAIVDRRDVVPQAGGGSSVWTCELRVLATQDYPTSATYRVTLIGTDSRNLQHSTSRDLRVGANPMLAAGRFDGAAGQPFNVTSGAWQPLTCAPAGASWHSWSVRSSGGAPIRLIGGHGPFSGFTAPAVAAATQAEFLCEFAVDGRVYASTVRGTIMPSPVPVLALALDGPTFIPASSTAAFVASPEVFAPGSTSGTQSTATVTWSLLGAVPPGLSLDAITQTAVAGAVVGLSVGTVTQPGYVTLRGQAQADGGLSAETRRRFVVQPSGGGSVPQLLATPSRVKSGEALTFQVAGTAGYGAFSWAVVRGPHILGGSPTGGQITVTAPPVSAPTDLVVRVAVAFTGPIGQNNPPVHLLEAQVRIEP